MIEKLNLPCESLRKIEAAYRRRPFFYEAAAKGAYDGEVPDYPIVRNSPLERLVLMGCCMGEIQRKYEALRIPEKIMRDTLADVSLRARLYQEKTGRTGLSKADVIWFRHLWLAEIFQLGSLQFQPFSMLYLDKEGCGEDYMTYSPGQKEILPPGTPVINVHIPTGANLSEDCVEEALAAAVKFFPAFLPEHGAKYFVCYSWLLYPGMEKILPKESSIRKFADRFQIIGTASDSGEALRRIYGRRYPRKADYPHNTTLQRNALGHFSNLGEACGILLMDNA